MDNALQEVLFKIYTLYSNSNPERTLYKRNFDAPAGLPRFMWVYPNGDLAFGDSKYHECKPA
jgi:hypothetical protein